jgi:hypothetical protein
MTRSSGAADVIATYIGDVVEQRDALLAALECVLAHERGIIDQFNALGEPSPAAFSLECERARAVLFSVAGEAPR